MITMTDEQKEVLNYVVLNADEWLTNAIIGLGSEEKAEETLVAKVDRWKPVYLAEKEKLGESYKTRAEREVSENGKL